MNNLKPNEKRAQNAIILIWIVLGLEVVSLISAYFQYELLQKIANGETVSEAAAFANDTREQILSILYLIAYIASAITFILWFRRAYFNLHQKINYLAYSEGWAVGSWFVPFINLYRPYQIMKEMFTETKELITNKKENVFLSSSINLLGWWWALWIINGIIGQVTFRYSLHANELSEFITSTVMSMAGNILGIPLAIVTIKLIKTYSEMDAILPEMSTEEEILDTTQTI